MLFHFENLDQSNHAGHRRVRTTAGAGIAAFNADHPYRTGQLIIEFTRSTNSGLLGIHPSCFYRQIFLNLRVRQCFHLLHFCGTDLAVEVNRHHFFRHMEAYIIGLTEFPKAIG